MCLYIIHNIIVNLLLSLRGNPVWCLGCQLTVKLCYNRCTHSIQGDGRVTVFDHILQLLHQYDEFFRVRDSAGLRDGKITAYVLWHRSSGR